MNQTQKTIFHTNTVMAPESWELMGVSAKDGETPIGQFGTGQKYALAVLLRTGHKVSIRSNGSLFIFGLQEMEFRGKSFQRVTCNDKPLAFTTDYGLKWQVEHAYRELVSNTLDEGGIHFLGEPMEEGTSIIVEGPEMAACLSRHNSIFLGDREPIAETYKVRFFEGSGTVWYRGVKVGELHEASLSYEIMDDLDLTEDRTIKYLYTIGSKIGMAMVKHVKDKSLIRRIVTNKTTWEAKVPDYDWEWSAEFSEVVKELWESSPTLLNDKIQKLVRQRLKDVGFKMLERTEDMDIMIQNAQDFLAKAGYPVEANIKVVDNGDDNNIAFAFGGEIHLTSRSFDKGMYYLVTTLFEESAHCKGHDDCSRSFQNYLIEELITQTRRRLKVAL